MLHTCILHTSQTVALIAGHMIHSSKSMLQQQMPGPYPTTPCRPRPQQSVLDLFSHALQYPLAVPPIRAGLCARGPWPLAPLHSAGLSMPLGTSVRECAFLRVDQPQTHDLGLPPRSRQSYGLMPSSLELSVCCSLPGTALSRTLRWRASFPHSCGPSSELGAVPQSCQRASWS